MKTVSIVVPILNEARNVTPLVKRIDKVMSQSHICYEIIAIDDRSTDSSWNVLMRLARSYPIQCYQKIGRRGKAQSLIEGFSHAKYSSVCMIDADLQYPPEAIPEMVKMLNPRTDIVVANRTEHHTSPLRQFTSKMFSFIFGKVLHKLSCDVQSGLKVFKKQVIKNISVTESNWAFDMEFLVKARALGYEISTYSIVFGERFSGKTKVSLIKASWEIGLSALRLKLFGLDTLSRNTAKFKHNGVTFNPYTKLDSIETALYRLSTRQKELMFAAAVVLAGLIYLNWHTTLVLVISSIIFIYFIDLLFNGYLIFRSMTYPYEHAYTEDQLSMSNRRLPRYTILCPLYKEARIAKQFIAAMKKMDYPKQKLQIIFLLEKDDTDTINKISSMSLPSYFEIRVVPPSLPKTKPKALNYGLKFTKGEYVAIYDAEDIPDPQQLKKAALTFEKRGTATVCVQAKLNYYNTNQNLLTRLFTLEYSLWFELVLPGLQSLNAPIPLGGTSNHFRVSFLNKLQGWDPFNVTEDADLGMRLAKYGYKTTVIDSVTLEEANSNLFNWLRQRSRWIKGYMQTYLVHTRNTGKNNWGWKLNHIFPFHIIIGGKILSMIINPLMWILTILYFAFRPQTGPFIETLFPNPIFYMGIFTLAIGNTLYMYYYMLGVAKRNHWDIVFWAALTPLYWLMMSIAAGFALYELFVRPHHWQKTNHGLHLQT
ncbi:glycosyltransferase [Candidatus Roizmanbacteria bacterium]|nr:glycosyltransferase [Candidatus Roizmanbacteria bacterium]